MWWKNVDTIALICFISLQKCHHKSNQIFFSYFYVASNFRFSFTCSLFFKVRSPFHSFSLCLIEPLPMYTIHNHFLFLLFIILRISGHSSSTSLKKLSSSTVILRTKFSSTALVCVVFFYLYFVRHLLNYFDGLIATSFS